MVDASASPKRVSSGFRPLWLSRLNPPVRKVNLVKIDLQKLLDALSEGTDLDTIITDEVGGQDLADIENEAIEAGKAIMNAAEKTAADADRIDAIVAVAQKV